MAKERFKRIRTNVNIGIVGQDNHGKNTLWETMEKQLQLQGRYTEPMYDKILVESNSKRINLVNSSGLTANVEDMIALVGSSDGIILVISAVEGTRVQTREHILLCRQLGIEKLIVYISKIDQVDDDKIKEVEAETKELLSQYAYNDCIIIKGNSLVGLESHSNNPMASEYAAMRALLEEVDKIRCEFFKFPNNKQI